MRRAKPNLLVFNAICLRFPVVPLYRLSAKREDAFMVVVGNYRNRAELRKKPRRQFHYTARIFIDKDSPPIACSISDISHSGARIALERADKLPDTFVLLLTANGGARRRCRVIWRDGTNVGVQFPDNR
jgi:PilZ domain